MPNCPSKSPLNHRCTLEEGHAWVHCNVVDDSYPEIWWVTERSGGSAFYCSRLQRKCGTFAEDFRDPCRCINCYLNLSQSLREVQERVSRYSGAATRIGQSLETMLDFLAQERRRIRAVRELASDWAKLGNAKVEGGYALQASKVLSQLKWGAATREFVLEDEQPVTCASCDKTHPPGMLGPSWSQLLLGGTFILGLECMAIDVCSPACLHQVVKEILTKKGEDDIA